MIFGIKEKSIILTHKMYCCKGTDCIKVQIAVKVLLAIVIPMLLKTGFVVQSHISSHDSSVKC